MEIFAETNANTFVRLPLAEKSDKDKETKVKALWFQKPRQSDLVLELSSTVTNTVENATPATLAAVNQAAELIEQVENDDRYSWYAPLAIAAIEYKEAWSIDTPEDVIVLCNELLGDMWTPLHMSDPVDTADRLNAILHSPDVDSKAVMVLPTGDDDWPLMVFDNSHPAARGQQLRLRPADLIDESLVFPRVMRL